MRKTWHEYFMGIAFEVAERSTCERLHVGAVIVNEQKNILATGYNGSMPSMPHCCDNGCEVENGHCINTIHAELNAVAQAAKSSVSINDSRIFVTHSPCWNCFKVLVNAGVKAIYYANIYSSLDLKILQAAPKIPVIYRRLGGRDGL